MSISATRERLEKGLLGFLWQQWSQMGVLAKRSGRSPWAADPEALLVLTFEVARADPRLFDEVLDWLLVNERLISVRRLRSLSAAADDKRLTDAVLTWLGAHRPKARFAGAAASRPPQATDLTHLHPSEEGFPIRRPDESFAAWGLLRAATPLPGHSSSPDLRAPINFAFRLRQLLGVGARAEVVRTLLTISAPRVAVWVIAQSAAFTKRNVQEALNDLVDAGVVTIATVGHEQRYSVERQGWAALLDVDGDFPTHVDWIQLFAALRHVLRWLRESDGLETSDYLLASQVRELLDEVRPDLEFAGLTLPRRKTSEESVRDLDDVVDQALGHLGVG